MQDLIRLVEFDIRGENKVNYFTKEEIELKDKTCNFIIPNASPFFGEPENFKLYNAKGGELKIGKDYSLVGEFIPFCDVSGRSVVTFIELSDEVLKNNDKVFATYISIGAYFIPREELDKWKDSLHKGKIPIDFEEKVHSIPEEALPPSHHLHNVREEITNWYDLTYFFHNLYGLVKGKDRNILATIDREIDKAFELMKTYRVNEQAKLTKHDRDYDNPHSVVSKDIDLGNVPNIGVATPEEILSGKGDDKFLTSESVELLLNGEVEENKDLMLPGVYPISRFGTGSYIPPSISGSFEGLGHENFSIACLEEEGGLVFLAPRFDGKSRGLYYFVMDKGVLTPTYHKYEHPFFRTNGIIPTAIYNNSGKDVMMVYDKAGGRLVIGSIGGTLNPEAHTWSFLTLPWGVGMGSATTVKLGRWVYVFQAVRFSTPGSPGTVNFRIARFLFERIGKDQLITAERVDGLSYTNADGDVKTGTAEIELFKNVPATATTSKQCFFNFVGVLPRNVWMNFYTSFVVKNSIGGGLFNIKFLVSSWIESVVGRAFATLEILFEYNPENPKVFKYKGSSPRYTVTDGGRFSLPGYNPSPQWMYYGGGSQTCWFDEETLTYRMGESRSNFFKEVKMKNPNTWVSENTSERQITGYGVSLANPLGIKPTLGSGVWGNGIVTFVSLKDTDSTIIRSGFKYNEGFKVRPEVYNESVKTLYSLPLPDKVKPLSLVNVPFRLTSNIAPLSEHTTNIKGIPSFGKMFASTNYVLAKGEFSLKLPTKTTITETEDVILIEGSVDRTYTKAALESLLTYLKGPKKNWREYPEVIIAIYEVDGEIAEGRGEIVKVPFFAVIDAYDRTDGVSTVVLYNIDKSKLVVNPTDIKVIKAFDIVIKHDKVQVGGISSSYRDNQPAYIKVSARDNGTYLIVVPTVQYRQISSAEGLDGFTITCTGANTTSPQWSTSNIGFWGSTPIFHDDLGLGFSPSETMGLESFRRRDVTGGCSVMINDFLFASTYPQEGWVIYFLSEQDVLINGSSYRLPIGSLDLRDAMTDPKDKTIYIYVSVENNKAFYYASLVEGARSVYHLLVAVVKTSKTKIESIERHQPIHIGDRKISRFREGAILPISTGLPQDEGWFGHLDGEDLSIE